jgi:hypothetical protein
MGWKAKTSLQERLGKAYADFLTNEVRERRLQLSRNRNCHTPAGYFVLSLRLVLHKLREIGFPQIQMDRLIKFRDKAPRRVAVSTTKRSHTPELGCSLIRMSAIRRPQRWSSEP